MPSPLVCEKRLTRQVQQLLRQFSFLLVKHHIVVLEIPQLLSILQVYLSVLMQMPQSHGRSDPTMLSTNLIILNAITTLPRTSSSGSFNFCTRAGTAFSPIFPDVLVALVRQIYHEQTNSHSYIAIVLLE